MANYGRENRNTIFVEDAELIEVREYPAAQYIVRLQAPETARHARPGSFVHLTCDSALPMRRPMSLMRVNADAGWIEILYKIVGVGLKALSEQPCGTRLSVMGPIGKPFTMDRERPIALMIGGGVGIPPMIYLAEAFANDADAGWQPRLFMGSEIPFPFTCIPSALPMDGMPADATHGLALVEDWGVSSRLASLAGLAGAHQGYVTELAANWLAAQDASTRDRCMIYACGPTPMLKAAAAVAERFDVPAQVSLEEYMACAVGGCAGCAVPVRTEAGITMQRVCVDGPVFDSRAVF